MSPATFNLWSEKSLRKAAWFNPLPLGIALDGLIELVLRGM